MLNDLLANSGQFVHPNGTDAEIELCLARRDPTLRPTNGITRTSSALVDETTCAPGTDANNDAQIKNGLSWNCQEYLNIWLVTDLFRGNGGCGLAGYAYFPGAGCNVDGIVMESRHWIRPNSIYIAAHELGHYLGLYHTFQGGCTNDDCMVDGDRVCDTPPDGSQAFAPCNTNSCNTDNPDLPDDNENIMDYSNCQPVRFTMGQRDRMHAVLETSRRALIQSAGCTPVANLDAALLSLQNLSQICDDSLCIEGEIRNVGLLDIAQVEIRYRIDGGTWMSQIWSGLLSTLQTARFSLPCLEITTGPHIVELELTRPNGLQDEFGDNNRAELNIEVFEPMGTLVADLKPSKCRSNGEVRFNVTGGVPPYSFDMSNGRPTQTSPVFTLMSKGSYTVTVTDVNGCVDLLRFDIPDSCTVSKPRDFVLNRDAKYNGDQCYTIVEDRTGRSGSLWYSQLVDLRERFITSFEMNLGCRDASGADGIAFVFQPVSTNIGVNGGGLGYQGISPSVAVEFDTWQNTNYNDPTYDHLGIMADGSIVHPGLKAPVPILANFGNVEDCNWRNVFISWRPDVDLLEVFIECERRIFYEGDIIRDQFGGNPEVYFGFTAATGAATNVHQVCVNYVSAVDSIVGDTICRGESVEIAAPSVFSTYDWFPTEGVSDPGIFNPSFSPDSTTTYYVRMGGECEDILDSVTIHVVPRPEITVDMTPDSCGEWMDRLQVTAQPDDAAYEYSLDGVNFQSSPVFIGQPGLNTVYVRLGRCVSAEVIEVKRVPILKDSVLFVSPETCDELGLFVITGKDGTVDYEYRLDNGPWSNNGRFTNLTAGVYTYDIRDSKGCMISGSVVIENLGSPLQLQLDSSDLQIDCCDSFTFISVSLLNVPLAQYQLDGGPLQFTGYFDNLAPGRHYIIAEDESECPTDTLWFEVIVLEDRFAEIHFSSCAGSDTVINGITYNETGLFFDTIPLAFCCDSIVEIQVEIEDVPVDSQRYEICPGGMIQIGSNQYSQSGIYLDTFQSFTGRCDSVVRTELFVLPQSRDTMSFQFCRGDSLNFLGRTIRNSGVYVDTLNNVFGCDSILIAEVVTLLPDTMSLTHSGCPGTSIEVAGTSYDRSGEYTINLVNQEGCDSTIYLSLDIHPEYEFTEEVTLCPGQTVISHGMEWTQPGVYQVDFQSQNGCDSHFVITISPEYEFVCDSLRKIFIPNVFSPDGNLLNDKFTIFGNDQLLNIDYLEIYDRWGELIYRGTDLPPSNTDYGWNGEFQGTLLNPGVFVYKAEVTFVGQVTKSYAGSVTLLR